MHIIADTVRPAPQARQRRLRARLAALAMPFVLAACGGGSGDGTAYSCDVADQKSWLRSYMGEWYFWYRLSPSPDPASYATLDEYFTALLYKGGTAPFPSDRWSYYQSTESFNRTYGEGRSLGYGLFVAGLEVAGSPGDPLYVRYIEAQSDAAAKGLRRGDRVLSVNGRTASEMIAADDFAVLSPANPGDVISVEADGPSGRRTVSLTAAEFALTPVSMNAVYTSPLGRKIGYVVVKDMISQSATPLEAAFAGFKAQGVSEVVLDLRYNGGGLVSVGASVASYASGALASGQPFAKLLYNDLKSSNNQTFNFQSPNSALGLSKVYVLAGQRTCSASEQVVNGLRPFVDVVVIGDTSCGKPVGFLPKSSCGTTYSAVNFESVNARDEGRYFDGFDATCPVAEDFTQPLGSTNEPLLKTAIAHADLGACPAPVAGFERPLRRRAARDLRLEPGERQDMIPR